MIGSDKRCSLQYLIGSILKVFSSSRVNAKLFALHYKMAVKNGRVGSL
jgi:hypothetical protein